MSNKAKGSRVERELIQLFTENSWRAVRVAGSGVGEDSPCDLLAAKQGKKAYVIEVKSSRKTTVYITKQQIEDFMLFASIIGLTPVIALRFNREGWLFLDPKYLKDTGKYWAASLQTAKEKGKRFSNFFENVLQKKSAVNDTNKISEEILNELDKEDLINLGKDQF
ncbi:MAG: Holliday junction resolvase Hjc [Nanoarchaeota archaeon]|nr:Holliday junction resolvase Hjc [Nanoarchaeota archaeon]